MASLVAGLENAGLENVAGLEDVLLFFITQPTAFGLRSAAAYSVSCLNNAAAGLVLAPMQRHLEI